jgi:hypothetical protein
MRLTDAVESRSLARRAVLVRSVQGAVAAILAACSGRRTSERRATAAAATENPTVAITVSGRGADPPLPFRHAEFGIVGVFDADWLTDPGFARLLDNLAASPGAFRGVRFFGALSSGTREKATPGNSGGTVWPDPAAPVDFSATLAALDALTTRGLVPFVQLSFFPAAVSPSPIMPPTSWETWQALVRRFLQTLASDPRFGERAIREWWFEVWNEPNIPVFWGGTFEQYLDLYRATSEAVRAAGYAIRLGGPALAWLPPTDDDAAGIPLMHRFLSFLHDERDVQCDFLSYHAKGTWTDADPMLDDLPRAADAVATMARGVDPARFRDLPIVNNEADEKVGFDNPYEPRMDARAPAWLTAVAVAHDALNARYADAGFRFLAAADNANLQLVQAPFDGRRSIMTRTAPAATTDLLKLPIYNAYELLRLLGDGHGTVLSGADQCHPATDLFHLLTLAPTHISALVTVYPRGTSSGPRDVAYTFRDIPWQAVNIVRFQIDHTLSNAYTAAGGTLSPVLDPSQIAGIRQAQELAVFASPRHGVSVPDGTLTERFTIAPFVTLLYWVTPFGDDAPAAPAWVRAEQDGDNVVIRWEPSHDPHFYSYELFAMEGEMVGARLSPLPLRAALWVDTAPPGPRRYGVRAVSASGIASGITAT